MPLRKIWIYLFLSQVSAEEYKGKSEFQTEKKVTGNHSTTLPRNHDSEHLTKKRNLITMTPDFSRGHSI